jgi:hypothetical protein
MQANRAGPLRNPVMILQDYHRFVNRLSLVSGDIFLQYETEGGNATPRTLSVFRYAKQPLRTLTRRN